MAKQTKITYTTSLDADLIKKLKLYCLINEKYQNEVIESLLADFLKKEGITEDLLKKEGENNGKINDR